MDADVYRLPQKLPPASRNVPAGAVHIRRRSPTAHGTEPLVAFIGRMGTSFRLESKRGL
jgi:hypothetical protein